MGIFTAKPGCLCCICFRSGDDVIPFCDQPNNKYGTHDTSPDDTGVNTSANESYSNDTFEADTVQTTHKSVADSSTTVPKTKAGQITKDGGPERSPPKPAAKSGTTGQRSESESDDSITM